LQVAVTIFVKPLRVSIGIIDYLEINPEYGNFIFIFLCGLVYQEMVFYKITSFQKQAKIFKRLFSPYLKPAKK